MVWSERDGHFKPDEKGSAGEKESEVETKKAVNIWRSPSLERCFLLQPPVLSDWRVTSFGHRLEFPSWKYDKRTFTPLGCVDTLTLDHTLTSSARTRFALEQEKGLHLLVISFCRDPSPGLNATNLLRIREELLFWLLSKFYSPGCWRDEKR